MPCAMSAVARTPRPVATKSKSSIGGAANSDEQRIVRSARGRHRRRPEPPYNKEQWGLPRAGDPHSLTGSAEDPFEQPAGRRGRGTVRRMSTAQIASAAVHTDRRAFTASSSGSADPTESCAARCCGEPRCATAKQPHGSVAATAEGLTVLGVPVAVDYSRHPEYLIGRPARADEIIAAAAKV